MKIETILFLFITLLFASCKQYYDYNANYNGDKLVVNGTIEANIGVAVTLSKSHTPAGIIIINDFNVKNGQVWLYQNDTLVSKMTLNAKGKYVIDNFKPQAGKAYRLKAVAENLDTAESLSVIMPEIPKINSYILKKDNTYAVYQGMQTAFFSANIQDNIGEKNYYMLDSYAQIRSDSIYIGYLKGTVSNLESCEFGAFANIVFLPINV